MVVSSRHRLECFKPTNRKDTVARHSDQPRRRISAFAVSSFLAFVLVLVTVVLPVPYMVETPGPVFNTLGKVKDTDKDVVEITGTKTYPTDGQLNMLTVGVVGGPDRHMSALRAFMGVLKGTETVVPTESMYPLDTTGEQVSQTNTAQMTSSQDIATAAALSELGMDYTVRMRVAEDPADGPARGKVAQGDTVLSINGKEVEGPDALQTIHAEVEKGSPVELRLVSGGKERTETVQPTMIDGKHRMGVLLNQDFDFPVDVKFNLDNIGGPSAGTVFALTIIDKLTEGPLAGDKNVAGTGAITADGTVQPIGGARQKVAAADDAGSEYFLSPRDNCAEAVDAAKGRDITVVRIDNLHAAKTALEDIAEDRTSDLPSCSADR